MLRVHTKQSSITDVTGSQGHFPKGWQRLDIVQVSLETGQEQAIQPTVLAFHSHFDIVDMVSVQ